MRHGWPREVLYRTAPAADRIVPCSITSETEVDRQGRIDRRGLAVQQVGFIGPACYGGKRSECQIWIGAGDEREVVDASVCSYQRMEDDRTRRMVGFGALRVDGSNFPNNRTGDHHPGTCTGCSSMEIMSGVGTKSVGNNLEPDSFSTCALITGTLSIVTS